MMARCDDFAIDRSGNMSRECVGLRASQQRNDAYPFLDACFLFYPVMRLLMFSEGCSWKGVDKKVDEICVQDSAR